MVHPFAAGGAAAAARLRPLVRRVRDRGGLCGGRPAGLRPGRAHLHPTGGVLPEADPGAQPAAARRDRGEPRRATAGPRGRQTAGPAEAPRAAARDTGAAQGQGTRDRLNTTAGSPALLGSVVRRDAGVVARLRAAGAVILGKASLSEWCNFRSVSSPSGWSARGGQGLNPYNLSADPCGSSSGSAIAVAANMVSVSLGTETDGSILCPSASNGVVGIKPTVGLTSRAGVIPISLRQDTVGPICRTVADAVHLLDVIVGFDPMDSAATSYASKFIPRGGYKQFLRTDGLKGKRLGILKEPSSVFQQDHFDTLRKMGAVLIDDLEIANASIILDSMKSGEEVAMLAEFKLSLDAYLSGLSSSPVRSLADVIDFNNKHSVEERTEELGQEVFLAAQKTSGIGPVEEMAIAQMRSLSENGFEKLMKEHNLDAVVTPDATASSILAIGGYPGITVPAGYGGDGSPFGLTFGGLKGSEPKLIEIAYGYEQATRVRKPPHIKRPRLINTLPMSKLTSLLLMTLLLLGGAVSCGGFEMEEATVEGVQRAFDRGKLTSARLVEYYLERIRELNPLLRAVIEVNPDALAQARRADRERARQLRIGRRRRGALHGVPVLLKDMLGTRDRLNTTAGALALLGSAVARDAGVVARLRAAGAIILGKASMSEWAHLRSAAIPDGWSARGGQGLNPYNLSADPCGSSSGSAIAVAANMAAVSLGTETDGSILCPSAANGVVGIKPTVGLTSRAGVLPISPRQDTIGPMCRTVADAVHLLDVIVGYDPRDSEATSNASKLIPRGGYKQFLRTAGLKGKRLGILREPFFSFPAGSVKAKAFEHHFTTLRKMGAVLIDNLEIANASIILDVTKSGELSVLLAEFKLHLNAYLLELPTSPVRSLADVIDFNNKHRVEERMDEFGQPMLLEAQNTSGIGPVEERAIAQMRAYSTNGLEKLMKEQNLDAVVTPDASASSILAIGGYPGITVPAGYDGAPFGMTFGGLRGSEPKLIEAAYGFEQATRVRKPPLIK
ncbi:hypothetical protein Taro_008787 [Colocasia esculenta]|uniref:Amidase domain-containing protein n=1 Tax=Colocasia esculenta TaxID=4460 RepID=A0A843TYJ4_COLES|nr:hypothetical protein [Colocasia esculenta]